MAMTPAHKDAAPGVLHRREDGTRRSSPGHFIGIHIDQLDGGVGLRARYIPQEHTERGCNARSRDARPTAGPLCHEVGVKIVWIECGKGPIGALEPLQEIANLRPPLNYC
jgi:hypothetical protein